LPLGTPRRVFGLLLKITVQCRRHRNRGICLGRSIWDKGASPPWSSRRTTIWRIFYSAP